MQISGNVWDESNIRALEIAKDPGTYMFILIKFLA